LDGIPLDGFNWQTRLTASTARYPLDPRKFRIGQRQLAKGIMTDLGAFYGSHV
jgi:hypothetical protein